MRINEVRKREVDVTLDADELVFIGNLIYDYEQPKMNAHQHDLAAQIIMARDLCQYGHLDTFSLERVMRHKSMAYPKSPLAKSTNTTDKEKER